VAAAIIPCRPADVLICGGGVHNHDLIGRLRNRLPGIPVHSTAEHGLDPDWVEATLFAWLARERLAKRLLDTRPITGAHQVVLLGDIAHPDRPEPG
jgi:anhydro-N-acetylmuramic acid kinase